MLFESKWMPKLFIAGELSPLPKFLVSIPDTVSKATSIS
jgi:hypothetical protein